MKFVSYIHIENSEHAATIEKLKEFDNVWLHPKWAVQDKIDGSNLQIAVDFDGTVHCGSRSQMLGEGASFFGFEEALENNKIKEKCKDIQDCIRDITGMTWSMVFYGELCGGKYDHPDVAPVKNVKAIQKRISYAPFVFWLCFDILIELPDGHRMWLAPDTVEKLCVEHNIPVVATRKICSLEEALNFDINYNDDTGVRLFDLPPVENNQVEGVVIKCMLPYLMEHGVRPILKNKNGKFKERQHTKGQKAPIEYTEAEQEYINKRLEFLTDSRMCSVMSKLTEDQIGDFKTLRAAFEADMKADIERELPEAELADEEVAPDIDMGKIKGAIGKAITDFVRPYYIRNRKA